MSPSPKKDSSLEYLARLSVPKNNPEAMEIERKVQVPGADARQSVFDSMVKSVQKQVDKENLDVSAIEGKINKIHAVIERYETLYKSDPLNKELLKKTMDYKQLLKAYQIVKENVSKNVSKNVSTMELSTLRTALDANRTAFDISFAKAFHTKGAQIIPDVEKGIKTMQKYIAEKKAKIEKLENISDPVSKHQKGVEELLLDHGKRLLERYNTVLSMAQALKQTPQQSSSPRLAKP